MRPVVAVALVVLFCSTCAEAGQESKPAFIDPWPQGSLWNSPLPAQPRVDPLSRQRIAYAVAHQFNTPTMAIRRYGVAVAQVSSSAPSYRVVCTIYRCPSMGRFGRVPIPSGTRPDPGSDGHLAVYDPAHYREWDFWLSRCPSNCARAGAGSVFSTRAARPRGAATAAGFPLLAGIVHPEEIRVGAIRHPLVFSVPNPGVGRVCPATQSGGDNRNALALREGMLLQLDPRVKLGPLRLPRWQRIVARALKRYGMYLVDGGGNLTIRAENPLNRGDLWAKVGLSGDYAGFSPQFPWGRLRVLRPPRPWCG
jgi:hypothetical protein